MAAAYAAVVSLVHLMDQIQLYDARQPIFLDQQHRQLLQSIHNNVIFLQEFLQSYSHDQAEDLETRIVDAAYAAEDIIETHIVDDIRARSKNPDKEKSSNHRFSEGLLKVIQDIDFIKKEIANNVKEAASKLKDHKYSGRDLARVGISLRPSSTSMKEFVVGFKDDLNQIMDKLTRINQSNLQIIPITGMGGIGKTTLANYVYVSPFMVQYFDIRSWVTISQEYDTREMLLGLLHEIGDRVEYQNELESLEYHELGEKLYKCLSGRRYLIVMDDMWSITAWEKLRRFLPDNNNESRIIVTTRLANVADYFGSSDVHKINLLDENNSWNLLCNKVFVQESCPLELEKIGKKIAKNCKGLPLSITVIGGLLANSKMTREYWKYIAKDISTTVNLEDNARCSKILSMSYNHLPVYLKPCFLYLGIFSEDREIRVSKLIKLWVAEGFLKPSESISLEEVAENHLKDLIDRNLVFVSKWGSIGHMKYCKIHDVLRDLCLREAEKKRFICINMMQNHSVLSSQRRIVIHHQFNECSFEVSRALQSASLARSLTCNIKLGPRNYYFEDHPGQPQTLDFRPPLNFRLLRMLDVVDSYPTEDVFQLVNARYIGVDFGFNYYGIIPSSICMLWNLQTLILGGNRITAPPEIWEMTQLRHLMIFTNLPDPLDGPNYSCVLENLQTLSEVINLRWTDEILGKIPNVKKLKLNYWDHKRSSSCRLNNLGRVHKLQSLVCVFEKNSTLFDRNEMQNLEFPSSLKKLTLSDTFDLYWEDITAKVGQLPNLEKLKLMDMCLGEEWNPVEGQFLRLKYLMINSDDLVWWRADETHFPCLENLVLHGLGVLEEIPLGIGDIKTLQSIQLEYCSSSAVASAKKILEEQQEFGNENLRLLVDGKPVDKDSEDDKEE